MLISLKSYTFKQKILYSKRPSTEVEFTLRTLLPWVYISALPKISDEWIFWARCSEKKRCLVSSGRTSNPKICPSSAHQWTFGSNLKILFIPEIEKIPLHHLFQFSKDWFDLKLDIFDSTIFPSNGENENLKQFGMILILEIEKKRSARNLISLKSEVCYW